MKKITTSHGSFILIDESTLPPRFLRVPATGRNSLSAVGVPEQEWSTIFHMEEPVVGEKMWIDHGPYGLLWYSSTPVTKIEDFQIDFDDLP